MIQRYHVAGLVVATAEPRDSTQGAASGLTITAATYDSTGLKGAQTLTVPPAAGEQPGKLLLRGVSATAEALEDGWKGGATGLSGYAPQRDATGDEGEQPATTAQGTLYPIFVALSGLGDWVGVRNRLGAAGGVQHVSLDALTRENAALTVDFAGDSLALQAALADSGYVLVQTAPADAAGPGMFQLRRGGPQGAAPR
jgi:hypothetical protein